MKKTLLFLLLAMMSRATLYAYDAKIDGIYYNFLNGKAEVTFQNYENYKYTSDYFGAVVIPSSVTYNGTIYNVTSIGNNAFSDCNDLASITIGNGVTSIGYDAFNKCTSLTSVTIPNSVTIINEGAFSYCSGLTSVTIPGSVTSIGNSAFYGCTSLTSVTIPESVTIIDDYTFYDCSGLTSVTIPNSVTRIGKKAFYGCSGLTSFTIPNSVTNIGKNAFGKCQMLTVIYCYAENVPSTEKEIFYDTYIKYATLHVPAESIEQYKATEPWSGFGTIVALDSDTPEPPKPEKCTTPTINYADGKLVFNSETEGAECVTVITDPDIKTHYGNEISLTATYTLSVYATKATFENSDTIQATLCWIDAEPATEGIVNEDAVTEVKALPVLIQTQSGDITIQGTAAGTPIAIYDASGKQYGSAIAEKDYTTIQASLLPGTIAVVEIGGKTIKVLVK